MSEYPKVLGILLFDEVEVLDFCGPFEVFSVTQLPENGAAFNVVTMAQKSTIQTRNGLSVNVDYLLENSPELDILLIPGGQGTRKELNNQVLMNWIVEKVNDTPLVLSVCTGALLLAKAGFLHGLQATTHANGVELLRQLSPSTKIMRNQRFVDNGKFVLSAGISAGIDMSFHIVQRLLGEDTAQRTAAHMEYER